jgi:hypothetical protein
MCYDATTQSYFLGNDEQNQNNERSSRESEKGHPGSKCSNQETSNQMAHAVAQAEVDSVQNALHGSERGRGDRHGGVSRQ